jgi:hypothetical protein
LGPDEEPDDPDEGGVVAAPDEPPDVLSPVGVLDEAAPPPDKGGERLASLRARR